MELFTLISAILAAVMSGISIYTTVKSSKKNRESNEKISANAQSAEDKRTKETIDANLTASARIEWIQNVRQATAKFIASCYKYLDSDYNEKQLAWEAVQEQFALYILYFGPDNNEDTGPKAQSGMDANSNNSKNEFIVAFVRTIYSNIHDYELKRCFAETTRQALEKCKICQSGCDGSEEIAEHCTIPSDSPMDGEECLSYKSSLNKEKKDYEEYVTKVSDDLQQLSEIMRIYLKIEWKRAKEGK